MKKILVSGLTALLMAVVFLTACGDNNSEDPVWFVVDRDGYTSFDCQVMNAQLGTAPLQSISDLERASLIFMREEEKLAHDVYQKLNNTWNKPVFANIAESENTHACAVLNLLNRYNIPDPVGTNGPGVFTNTTLQHLYDSLSVAGVVSLVQGLTVGAAIEEIDIRDLKNALLDVDNADIEFVYENLMSASRNHLRAFVRNLEAQGVTYAPQYLSQAEYNQIINGNIETGPKGKGW